MGKITKNYMYNILFQMLILFMPLVLSPYLVRILGAERLGTYSYITSIANIITTIGLLGTYNYGCRQIAFYRDNLELCKNVYMEIYTLRIVLGIAITIVYIVVSFYELEFNLYFIVYYSWVLSMILDPSWFFVGQEDMKKTVVKNTVIRIVCFVLVFLMVKSKNDLITYASIMGFSALIGNFALYFQLRKYGIKNKLIVNNFGLNLKQSFSFFLPQVASVLYLQVDKIMLRYLSQGISEVSFYDYGEKIVTIPLTFITVLSTVMMPRIANEFAKDNKDEMKRLLYKVGSYSLMLAIPMMVGIALCAEDLIPWYLGESYLPSISAIVFISPIIVTNSLTGISGNQYFIATNQMGIVLKAYISAAVTNVIVNAFLIPRYGSIGAGMGTTISAVVSIIIQYYYLHKQIGVKVYLNFTFKYTMMTIPMAITVFFIGKYLPSTPLTTILQIITGGLVYMIELFVSKDENIKSMLNKLRKFK